MFTGIVERVGRIESLEKGPEGGRLRVHAGPLAASLAIAGSVAVTESPFVKVLALTGVPQAAGIMNFVIVSAALSASTGSDTTR